MPNADRDLPTPLEALFEGRPSLPLDATLADFEHEVDALFDAAARISPEEARVWTAQVAQTPAETLSAFIGHVRRLTAIARRESAQRSAVTSAESARPASLEPELFPGFAWDEVRPLELAFEDDFSNEDWPTLMTIGRDAAAALQRALEKALRETRGPAEASGDPAHLWAWLAAFSRHRPAMGLAEAEEKDPLRLFLIDFTRRRRLSLLAWQKAVEASDKKPPHALWWY